jgi:hypothetical protein
MVIMLVIFLGVLILFAWMIREASLNRVIYLQEGIDLFYF